MFLLSIVYGTLISLAAVVLEEISYRRYGGSRPAAADRPRDRRELRLPPAHHVVAPEGDLRLPEGQGRLGRDDAQGIQHQVTPASILNLQLPIPKALPIPNSQAAPAASLGVGRWKCLGSWRLEVGSSALADYPGAISWASRASCPRRPRRGLRGALRSPDGLSPGSRRSGRAAPRPPCGRPAPA